MEALETEKYKGCIIKIYSDFESGESPREWDNVCELHCWHRKMNLGDFNYTETTIEELNTKLREAKKNRDIVVPLYIYQHSGVVLSLQSFRGRLPQGHYEFDSGRVGFVIIRRKKALEEFSNTRLSPQLRAKLLQIAEGEIKTYNQFLCGDVYGYEVEDKDGEHIDSCWGYYGREEVMKEAKGIVDIEQARVKV